VGKRDGLGFSPWWLVVVAAAALGIAGTYQFAWSAIRLPVENRLDASEAAIGTVFTLFILFQTTIQFPAGWVRDRWGPQLPLLVSAVLVAVGYVGIAQAGSIWHVYVFYSLGGMGVGIIYTVAVNTPVKWFDGRRGLATGIALFSYAGASFVLIPIVREYIISEFELTLTVLGLLAGLVALAAVPIMRDPAGPLADDGSETDDIEGGDATGDDPVAHDDGSGQESDGSAGNDRAGENPAYTWRESVRTWQFWLLYVVFIAVNGVSLMLIGKVIAYADNFGVAASAATAAASLVALGDSAGGVVIGGGSDRFGKVRTVGIALLLAGVAIGGLVYAAEAGLAIAFVAFAATASFFRSAPFYIFPGLVGDYYGERYSSSNYALLYTGKLWGGVAGGTVASGLIVSIGWTSTFLIGGVLAVLSGIAMFFVKPVDPG